MRTSELVRWLDEHPQLDEIFVRSEDGYLHDFSLDMEDETFDGFDTVHPACATIEPIK